MISPPERAGKTDMVDPFSGLNVSTNYIISLYNVIH